MTTPYKCIICNSGHGEAVLKRDGKPSGSENWYWHTADDSRIGPMCSQDCGARYRRADNYERLFFIFEDTEMVERILRIKKKALGQHEQGTHKLRWDRVPFIPFPERLDQDKDFGPVRGVSPYAEARNSLCLIEDDEAIYAMEVS